MRYNVLTSTCGCGRPATSIKQVILTSERQLMLRWRCPDCKKMVYAFKPLADCWRECPREATTAYQNGFSPDDRQFLASIGVMLPETGR